MNILDFKTRINMIDTFLNNFSLDPKIKFYILIFIHFMFIFTLDYFFLFTKNYIIFGLCFSIIIFQIILNAYDNGCIFIKLERKYIGKDWFGLYTIANYIKEDTINKDNSLLMFKIFSFIGFVIGIYRLYTFIYKTKPDKIIE